MAISAVRTGSSGLPTTDYAQWNFNRRIVSPGTDVGSPNAIDAQGRNAGLDSNRFASAKAFLVCAGPPLFRYATGNTDPNADTTPGTLDAASVNNNIVPIGLVQDINMQQERAISEIYEIGSRATYYMVGRGTRRLSLSSIVYDGANLMRALYQNSLAEFPAEAADEGRPAYEEDDLFYSNLDSSFFEASTGLYIRVESLADARDEDRDLDSANQIGGMYLEECYVRAYGLTSNANNTIVAENTVITFSRVLPVRTSATSG